MQRQVLTEQALYFGDVAMPKDWDIDRDKLSGDILQSVIQNKDFPFSRTWDMLNTYMRDFIGLDYDQGEKGNSKVLSRRMEHMPGISHEIYVK